MYINAENDTWINTAIDIWQSSNIELNEGASTEMISYVEDAIGFKFPESFKKLYNRVNGFDNWTASMVTIRPLHRILEEAQRYPNFIGFSDYCISLAVYGFQKDSTGIYKHYDSEVIGSPEKIAESFEEAIFLINANSILLF